MWLNDFSLRRRGRPQPPRRRGPRLTLEQLEDRLVPANFTAASPAELVADINAANLLGGPNTITLAPGATFTLSAADNATDGGNGLPVIAAGDDLTIVGSGDVIERSTATGTPAFRLLDVAAGAALTLANLTLQGGLTLLGGGAVHNQGALTLDGVSVQNNVAVGANAAGGGIWSSGALTLGGNTIVRNNQALGPDATVFAGIAYFPACNGYGGGVYVGGGMATLTGVTLAGNTARGGDGGIASNPFNGAYGDFGGGGYGGGLFVGGGTVTLTNVSLSSNTAQGGAGGDSGYLGGWGGDGFGGGLCAAGGSLALHTVSVTGNSARGGAGGRGFRGSFNGSPGLGEGGGLYIDPAAFVCLDVFTQAHVTKNKASTLDPNIHGPWTPC
jgi:hypothetical protein